MASYSLVWNLGKQVQGLAFSGEVWLEHFSTLQGSIQFEGICLLKVLIREAENQGIPSRAMLELGHCCTVYLVIVWSVSWHHPLSGVGKKATCLLLSLAPLESWFVQDPDCPILFWFFWIFIIKKSPNASARSFNESESGYCSMSFLNFSMSICLYFRYVMVSMTVAFGYLIGKLQMCDQICSSLQLARPVWYYRSSG